MPKPAFGKLDRVLIYPDWEDKYPLAVFNALEREISDHTHLLLDTGEHKPARAILRFENARMLMEGFKEFIEKNWWINCKGSRLDIWREKLGNIR